MRGWVLLLGCCAACGLDCPEGTREVEGRCAAIDASVDGSVDAPAPDDAAGDVSDATADTTGDGSDVEVCNGLDDDGDDRVDEGLELTFFLDDDGDGAGDPDATCDACDVDLCPEPGPWVAEGTDCDDTCFECAPGAAETCDGRDNDCDDRIDETALTTFHRDADEDDFGDDDDTVEACVAPEGYVGVGGDCDDGDERAFPTQTRYFGIPNSEVGFDWNCDGTTEYEIETAGPPRCTSGSCPTTRRWVDSHPSCGTQGFVWYCSRPGGACGSPVQEIDAVTAFCR